MKTSRAHVVGLGSAKSGTGHWWSQRLTAIALIPLTVLFLFPFLEALKAADADAAAAVYQNPFNAIVAALFIATLFYHLKLGLQIVIEDYVHAPFWRMFAVISNTLFCVGVGFAGVAAVVAGLL